MYVAQKSPRPRERDFGTPSSIFLQPSHHRNIYSRCSFTVGISGGILLVLITSSVYVNEIKAIWTSMIRRSKPSPVPSVLKFLESDDELDDSDISNSDRDDREDASSILVHTTDSSTSGSVRPPLYQRALRRLRRRGSSGRDAERDGSRRRSGNEGDVEERNDPESGDKSKQEEDNSTEKCNPSSRTQAV
jgi:hypothetical protein